ncbi:MAG: UDP-N-acetylglucosamine 2-epimerase (non-hydrolyzing) [Negativicutes bacterium]
MKKLKVMTVFGTRPEAIKMAPLALELKKYPEYIESMVTVTAQHREMLDQVLDLFSIVPDYDLNIMSHGQTLSDITCKAIKGLEKIFAEAKPDIVLVHGDTTTTFAGALAAFYQQISVGHVEAGLRTGNKYSPWPEEMNRKLTGAIADYHFAPTTTSAANLLRENVDSESVFITGNTVIDALINIVQPDFKFPESLNKIDFNKRLLIVTTHRRENLGEPLRNVYRAIRRIITEFPDTAVVFPMHKNPLVRAIVDEELSELDRVHLIEPLEYQLFANLIARSHIVLTDSGGVQEEAPALGKPVLVLRDTTERPEAIAAGTVRLVGTDEEVIYEATRQLLADEQAYAKMSQAVNPYGDGIASERIVRTLLWKNGLAKNKPVYFC